MKTLPSKHHFLIVSNIKSCFQLCLHLNLYRRIIVPLFLILSFFCPFSAHSAEVRENYNGARSLAMGGASIAVVNDETALLSNPAGLGKLRDKYGTLLDPELDMTSRFPTFYLNKAISNPFDITSVSGSLSLQPPNYYHAEAKVFPSFVVRNFGIGIMQRYTLDAIMNSAGTQMTTNYLDDQSLYLGYNFRLFGGRIKLGFVGKAISRIEVNKDLDVTGDLTLATNASEGLGLGGDVGLILTGPWTWLPTISAVVRDLGSTSFEGGSGLRLKTTTRPQTLLQDYDVAVSIFPIHSNRIRSSFTLEYQKINEAALATDKTKYYHGGWELNIGDLFFTRLGMNGRYWTGGLELASEHTQFQISSYGEDVGTDGSPIEDRRMVMKFALRF